MNKKIIATIAILIPLMFGSAAFANSEQVIMQNSNQQWTEEVTEEDLIASQQDYLLEQTERVQSRRSALFAHILDTIAKSSTRAGLDHVSSTLEG